MSQVDQLIAPTDTRLITPTDLQAAITGIDLPQAEDLADESGEWLTGKILGGRPLHRATYSEVLTEAEVGEQLRMNRWPVEKQVATDVIQVNLGGDALASGLYRVAELCRNVLRRVPEVETDAIFFTAPIFTRPRPGEAQDFSVPSFIAGYVLQGQITTWTNATLFGVGASTSYDSGAEFGWARATDRTVSLRFEVTAVGTQVLGGSEPIWPTTIGGDVVSDGVTYTARAAVELKPIYKTVMVRIAQHLKQANKAAGKPCKGDDCGSIESQILRMIKGAC